MFRVDENGFFKGFFPNDKRKEYYNLPRQVFSKAYHPNGYVDIVRPGAVERTGVLYGQYIRAFITPFTVEVDTPEDLEYLEYWIKKDGNVVHEYLKEHFTGGVGHGRI
jgi:CMP-N-acetylneuraminic acid synthetase